MTDESHRGWLVLAPNLLTGLRLGLTFAFPFIEPRWWALVILVAGLSDLADGFIARRFDLATWIGGLLDAVADKAFTLVVLVTFILTGRLAWWMVAVLFIRDIAVVVAAVFAVAVREWGAFRLMSSRWFGKLTTTVIFTLLVVVALWPEQRTATLVLVSIGAVLSCAAGIDYFVQFLAIHARWKRGELGHNHCGV